VSVVGFAVSRVLAAQRHPDTVAERARFQNHEDTKAWDRALSLWLLLANVAVLLLAGPDARLDWTPGLSVAIKTVALLAMLAGYALSSYALIGNRYFSAVVRIQTDRDQQVIFTGPYAWVRHPGYAGGLLVYLATPALHSAPPISALPGATRSRFQQIYPNWPQNRLTARRPFCRIRSQAGDGPPTAPSHSPPPGKGARAHNSASGSTLLIVPVRFV